jgi:hypothetical protein
MIAHSLLFLRMRRDALAELPPGKARDPIIFAGLDEMISARDAETRLAWLLRKTPRPPFPARTALISGRSAALPS